MDRSDDFPTIYQTADVNQATVVDQGTSSACLARYTTQYLDNVYIYRVISEKNNKEKQSED